MRSTALLVASLVALSSVAIAATAGPSPSAAGGHSRIHSTASGEPAVIGSTASGPVANERATAGSGVRRPAADLASPPENTTTYLAIPPGEVRNDTTERSDLDVAGSLAVDGVATEGRLATIRLDDRLSAADATAMKRAIIADATARIEGQIDRLRRDQAAAIAAYNDGTISARGFVSRLARITTRAAAVRAQVDRVDSAAAAVPGASIDSWARDRAVELGVFTSPVREAIIHALDGETAINVYIETTADGVVLAAIDRGRYVREAYVPAQRDNGSVDGPNSISGARDRVATLYPWAGANSTGVHSGGGPHAGAYRFTLFHQQGRLTTYLDPDTGTVFREVQVKLLSIVPTTSAVGVANDGLRLQVNRTHPTGPMNVSVRDAATDEPINTTVVVEGRTVGQTGSDGQLWAIAPRGGFNVTADDGENAVVLTTSPSPTTRTADPTALTAPIASGNRTNGSTTRVALATTEPGSGEPVDGHDRR